MHDIIVEGGWPMFPVLVLGLSCLLLAGRHAAVPQRSLMPLILGAGVAALLFGAFGTTVGLMHAIEGTQGNPEMRWLWVVGLKEALHNIAAALALTILAAPLAAIGSWKMARRIEAIDARG